MEMLSFRDLMQRPYERIGPASGHPFQRDPLLQVPNGVPTFRSRPSTPAGGRDRDSPSASDAQLSCSARGGLVAERALTGRAVRLPCCLARM